jgi:uncharacterized protein YecA (UPF0149 family)
MEKTENQMEPAKPVHVHGPQCNHGHDHQAHAKPKIGRNDPCPCGSSKKYKKCCGAVS